jgi:hypothetical protein
MALHWQTGSTNGVSSDLYIAPLQVSHYSAAFCAVIVRCITSSGAV